MQGKLFILVLSIRALGSKSLSDNFAQQINDSSLDFLNPNPDIFLKPQIALFAKYQNLAGRRSILKISV